MILVDTSVWIDHLRHGNDTLSKRLLQNEVLCHPMIIGELACGSLTQRKEILSLLHALPDIECGSNDEILFFIEEHRLFGRGLGLVDIHLLASCALAQASLWTLDKKLRNAAKEILK